MESCFYTLIPGGITSQHVSILDFSIKLCNWAITNEPASLACMIRTLLCKICKCFVFKLCRTSLCQVKSRYNIISLTLPEPDLTCRGHSGAGLSRQDAEYHDHSTLRISSPSQEPSPSSQHSTPQVRRRSSGSEVNTECYNVQTGKYLFQFLLGVARWGKYYTIKTPEEEKNSCSAVNLKLSNFHF